MVPVSTLTTFDFFEELPPEALRTLAEATSEVAWAEGEFVVRQHAKSDRLYVLVEGAIAFLLRFEGADDFLVGASQTPGLLIGWSAFRPPFRYTASVRCEAPSRFLEIPKAPLSDLMEADPRLGYHVLCRVAEAVAARLEQARDLLVIEPEEAPPEGASY